jgi:hypothetical protein
MNENPKLEWRPALRSEREVTCDGCGGTFTPRECTVTGPRQGPCFFACSPQCEEEAEKRIIPGYGTPAR